MFHVYAIDSLNKNYLYIGITENLGRRFRQHQDGKNKTTAPYRPFILILNEVYGTRVEARKREKHLKSGCGKEWIKNNYRKKR